MKAIKFDYIPENLIVISDSHIGSMDFAKETFEKIMKWIYKEIKKQSGNRKPKIILNGDIMEVAIKLPYLNGQFIDINEQLEYAVKWFKPIQKHILGSITGNHERRIYNSMPFNLHRVFCNELEVLNLEEYGFFIFENENVNYTMFCKHQNGNAVRPSSQLTQLIRMNEIIDADIYVLGHSHCHIEYFEAFNRMNKETLKSEMRTRCYCYSGHCLEYSGYALVKGYKPTGKPNFRRLYLNPNKFQVKIL